MARIARLISFDCAFNDSRVVDSPGGNWKIGLDNLDLSMVRSGLMLGHMIEFWIWTDRAGSEVAVFNPLSGARQIYVRSSNFHRLDR